MQLLNVTKFPIYLPYDKAPVPFGDPLSDATMTATTLSTLQTPSVFTVPGYTPNANDRVGLSVLTTQTLDTAFPVGTAFYVVSQANNTFSLSTAKNGNPLYTYTTSSINTSGALTVHLLSNQVDGALIPFKTGYSVVAFNLSTATIYLNGAADLNVTTYGNPQGPGAYSLMTSIASGAAAIVPLNYDWIVTTSAGPGTLPLVQN